MRALVHGLARASAPWQHASAAAAHVQVQAPVSPSKAASPRSSPSARLLRASASEKLAAEGAASNIATFYFPKAPPTATDVAAFRTTVSEAFAAHGGRVTAAELQALLPRTCACAGYIAYLAFEHLGLAAADARLGVADFVRWWAERDLVGADAAAALFQAVKRPGEAVVTQERLLAFMQHVLRRHPGLEFLQETAEFQERYAQTVVYRIMYLLDRSEKGHLTEADVRRSALPAAVAQLDTEDDINKVLKFFSYEHFYVMYCKFWELDQDHDFMIDRDDLLRYGGHGLTYRIVERIFGGAPRRMTCGTAGKMAYEDFVYFILSEEDKTTDASLKYWHRCIDLDDDGVITAQDMWFFYEEQLHRMESASQAPVSFGDVMCQMQDMLNPEQAGCFTLRDLRRGRALAGAMFNILFNLGKFVAYETRDPFVVRQVRAQHACACLMRCTSPGRLGHAPPHAGARGGARGD